MKRFGFSSPRKVMWAFLVGALLGLPATAHADMVLSQVIIDLPPSAPPYQDIEVWNSEVERIYVVAEPSEILSPGNADERRVQEPDPQKLGLLVTPNRLILEPGERKLIRVATIAERTSQEHIYRIAIKPVVGDITAKASSLKILVGYDALVIVRPLAPHSNITATREARSLVLRNEGNTNAELFDGKQCDVANKNCVPLPPKRLYAGTSWQQSLTHDGPVTYTIKTGDEVATRSF